MKMPCLVLAFGLCLCLRCAQSGQTPLPAAAALPAAGKVKGLTLVAPPEPFPADPIPAVKNTGANWIAVVPYAFTRLGQPSVRYDEHGWQWWGERPVGVRETVRLAHASGVRVMLKPQVYIPGAWTGSLDFSNPEEWTRWENDYTRYILRMALLADSTGVDLFCIGTEFRTALAKRPAFWSGLIAQVRRVYRGKLVYSANWDDWEQVPFWPALDFIGLSGYFPLIQGATPDVADLKAAWQPICRRLRAFSREHDRPVLFTEFGYLSVDGCGWRNWELEKTVERLSVNQQAQANCLEALFSTLQGESWWAGGFLWKWFPNMRGHEGYPERDYTPQGKAGEAVLRKWYGS